MTPTDREVRELKKIIKRYYPNDGALHDHNRKYMFESITALIQRRENLARIEELQNFTVDMDYPIFFKASERITELKLLTPPAGKKP